MGLTIGASIITYTILGRSFKEPLKGVYKGISNNYLYYFGGFLIIVIV